MDSPRDVHIQITHKLTEDGLNPASNDLEKLLFLWKLYQHAQDDLVQARTSENRLKDAQAAEMKEVESYVEHIRQLSDERESLIQELESENEVLKTQIVSMGLGGKAVGGQPEVAEMLTKQGLAELAKSTPSEQIAYLLVERARLLEELEERQSGSSNQNSSIHVEGRSSETELKETLEQERAEFEQELKQEKESAKNFLEQLKREHEEEISALIEDNGKLEEDLQNAEMLLSQLKAELSKYTEGEDLESSMNEGMMKSGSTEDRRRLEEERNELNRQREDIEKEMEEIESDRADFQKEKDLFYREKVEVEKEKSNIQSEMSNLNELKEDLEDERKEIDHEREVLEQERQQLKKRMEEFESKKAASEQDDLLKEKTTQEEDEKEGARAKTLRSGSPARPANDMMLRKVIEDKTKIEGELVQMKAQMRSMQKEKDAHDDVVQTLKKDLEKSLVLHQQLQHKNRNLIADLDALEAQMEELETKLETVTKERDNLAAKCESLSVELKILRADANKSSTLQDIVEILTNDKKQLTESLETIKIKYEQTSNEKEELVNQTKKLSKEEQDLTNHVQALKQELEKVTREKEQLTSEKQELFSVTKKQEEVENLLRADLEETRKIKERLTNQTETLSKENKDLLNRLDRAKDELEAARLQVQEIDKQKIIIGHLKDQNQQVQGQLKSAQLELERSKEKETMLITNQHLLQRSHGDTEKSLEQLTHEVDDLKLKLELSLQELAKSKRNIEELSNEKTGLRDALNKANKLLDESSEAKNMLAEERRLKNQMKVEINRLELDLQEKTTLAEKFANERFQRLELETQVTCLRDGEERFKAISKDLEREQNEKRALEVLTDELKRKIAAMANQEELQAAKEECNKERQLNAQMDKRVKDLEHSLRDTEISRDSANELLENERQLRLSLEKTVKELQAVTGQQTSVEELTRLKDELNKERAALKDLEESEADVQLLCVELEKQRTLNEQLARKVEELESAERESSSSTLKATLDELDRERKARAEDNVKILDLEQLLDDQRIDNDNMEQKIIALEQRVTALEDELFATQDELQALQDDHDKVVKELEVSRAEVMSHDTVDGNQRLSGGVTPESSRDKDLESSPSISTAKLNEAYNDLNTVKTKLFHTQEEFESAKIELESSRQDLSLLKQSLDMSNKHLEKSENELRALRKELAETQGSLEFTQNQLRNKQTKLESLARDRDELQSELDAISDAQQENLSAVPFFEKERQEHMDKIATFEKLTRQLELDNREMARKLTDTLNKCEILEGQLDREKFRSSDKHLQSRRYTEQLEQDLDTANSQIRQLREEMQQHQTKVFKAESDTLGLSAKYESTIARLEQDNKDLQQRQRHDIDVANRRLETASSEARELKIQNRGLEEEVNQLRTDVSRLKSTNEQLESHLQAEQKQRQELENRNSVIDSELTKTWNQVRSLMEKNAHLEAASRSYEQDINMQRNNIQKIEHSLGQKEATYEASTKAIVARAENAERKTRELQRELEEVTQKMLHIESQLTHAEKGKVHMEDAKDRLVAIRNQLEGEKLQRTLLDQTVADLKHEVAMLKQREAKVHTENKELQHTIIELESRLNRSREFPQKDVDSVVSESGQRSLMDQIARLQREVKDLQHELYNVSERRDVDMKRYEERKLRTKSKLIKAREFYTNERTKCMEQMKCMDDDLRLTHATLSKELEWREKMDVSYKEVIRDKRELITQLSELEESLRDTKRGLSISQGRVDYLEEENARLLDLVETLTQEKYNSDRLLKEKTLALSQADFPNGTSTDNNQNTGWDMYDRLDQTVPIEPPANFRESETDDDVDDSQSKRFRRGSENDSGNITFVPRGKGKFPVYSQINEFKFSHGEFYDDGDEFEA